MKITLHKHDLPEDLTIDGDIAIDCETMGLNLHRDRLCLIQISNSNEDVYLVQFDGKNYDAPNLKKMLLEKSRCKIFHYARFDLAAIKQYLGIDLENIFCTKIVSRLVRTYTDSHGLKELCRELLAVNISKQMQSSYWGSGDLTNEQLEYAAKDVLYLHKIKNLLTNMLHATNRYELAHKIFEFLPTRANLDLHGWNDIDILGYN